MKRINWSRTGIILLTLFATALSQELPKDPLVGREVLEKEECLTCHSINGVGGTVGPDFGKKIFFGNAYELLSKMWNHSPKMMAVMEKMNTERPRLSGKDFKELANFLYFIRFLGLPGNLSRGSKLFISKGCVDCHSVGERVAGKIALDSMKIYVSPVRLAQAMWNHSTLMQRRGESRAIKLPTFSDNEFADLTAYIREASSLKSSENIYSYPGDPFQGERLFKEKGCYYCHVEKSVGPRLDQMNMQESVTEIAGVMWNHSAEMSKAMKSTGKQFPMFIDDQMADIISYLYFKDIPHTNGSEADGRRLFGQVGCITCHQAGNRFGAPTLGSLGHFYNRDEFLAALWNHAPRMEELLLAKGHSLPTLMPNEIKSLYLFIDAKTKSEK